MKSGSLPAPSSEKEQDSARNDLRKAHEKLRLAAKIAQRIELLQSSFSGKQSESEEQSQRRDHSGLRKDAHESAQILRRMMRPTDSASSLFDPALESADLSESCRGRRILLADDDPMVLKSARLALQQAGYSVVCSSSGSEAWEIFSKSPRSFDLLLSDISMPSLDGASLVQQALLLHPKLKIILISGYFDERAADDLVRSGKGSFLAKPFDLSTLIQRVNDSLAG